MIRSFERWGRFHATARGSLAAPALVLFVLVACAGSPSVAASAPGRSPAGAMGVRSAAAAERIVYFGDSITYGFGSDYDRCLPATLGSNCYADDVTRDAGAVVPALRGAREVNMGVVGSCLVPTHTKHSVCAKAVSGEARIPRFIAACRTARYAVIMFGANDALDSAVTIERFERVLNDAIDGCHAAGVPLRQVLVGQTTFRPRTTNAFLQERIGELVAAEGVVAAKTGATLAATFAPLERCGKPCFRDWVHPNGRGHRRVAKAFLRALRRANGEL